MSKTIRYVDKWCKNVDNYYKVDDRSKRKAARARKGAEGFNYNTVCGSIIEGKLNTYDDISSGNPGTCKSVKKITHRKDRRYSKQKIFREVDRLEKYDINIDHYMGFPRLEDIV